ncbi:hypothetical protein [Mucilaginibacter aquatilis]|uniref:Uncharacterized protein n=1 Tax=Mucilaginibacter aquatilis TaxID=1517760 RepID=A0A6I4I747_9SPHI|nr:hypothetical protein [Mucilaginibacter aquatilis]MVN90990.1 hypothetical protein [Mucilaginibacter aquatilis]
MITADQTNPDEQQGQEWENPQNPEQPSDSRNQEQVQRQFEEAKRRKDNLSETDHIDKEKKTE